MPMAYVRVQHLLLLPRWFAGARLRAGACGWAISRKAKPQAEPRSASSRNDAHGITGTISSRSGTCRLREAACGTTLT